MNKILVRVFFPKLDRCYDVWIPINKTIYSIICLLSKGANELTEGSYQESNLPILYNRSSGLHYDINAYVKDTDIKNGTELILI